MEPKIIEEKPVSMGELKEEIEKIRKRDKEPSIRVTKVEEYLQGFEQLTPDKEKELREALKKLEIPRLKDEQMVKIVDLQPKTADELKLIMQCYVISISGDNIKKIVDTVKSVA